MSHEMNATTFPNNITVSYRNGSDDLGDNLWAWRVGLFGVGGLIVACFGIVGNSLSIVVLAHYKRKISAQILLICLSLFDTIYLVFEAMLENLTFIAKGGLINDNYRIFVRPVYGNIFPVPEITQVCVIYTVVVITIERHIAVVWPFRAHFICRKMTAIIAILVIIASSILYHIPVYLAYDYKYIWINETQTLKFNFFRTEFGLGHFYNHVYHTWINMVVKFVVPFTMLLVLNLHMVISLKRLKTIVNTKNRKNQDHRLTIMVVSMVAIFFFCSLFRAISFILTTGLNEFEECDTSCNRFSAVADFMAILNSAINFAIYCASGKNFRDIFKKLFCCRVTCRPWTMKVKRKFLPSTEHHKTKKGFYQRTKIWTVSYRRSTQNNSIII